MFRAILVVSLAVLAACDSGPGISWGDPQLAVTDGDGQTAVVAVADSLEKPVSARLYQTAESGITFRIVTPAYAQTPVQGVPGHQVCAVAVDNGNGLKAWNPCAITDTAGIAKFFFEPGTKAGRHCSEIRAVVNDQKVVADSVCATVEAGPLAHFLPMGGGGIGTTDATPFWFEMFQMFKDEYDNSIPYTVTANGAFVVVQGAIQGNPRWGVKLAPGAEVDDTGVVNFLRGADTLAVATGTVVATSDPARFGVAFAWSE